MSKLGDLAHEVAIGHYKKGVNCAETMVKTFDELCSLDIGENVKYATGFGGGMGYAGDVCGVVSGGVFVLGAFKGRSNPPEGSRDEVYALSKEFNGIIVNNFGDTTCRVLHKFEFGTKEQRVNCMNLIGDTAKLLGDFLVEKKIVEDIKN